MKIAKTLILSLVCLLVISCLDNDYETISVETFETALKNKNVNLISFGPGKGEIKIEFKDKENFYLIKNDSIKPEIFKKYINNLLNKYNTENIVFETKTNFYNF